jgi:signal transduction histidine kinase
VLIAVAVAVLSLASLWNPPAAVNYDFRDPDALGVALSLLGAASVAGRSREPFAAWCVALASCLVLVQLGYSQTLGGLPALLALYTVAVRARFALSVAVAVTTIVAIGVVLITGPIEPSTGDWIANTLVLTLGWSFGRSVRNRRARLASLDARDEAVAAAETAHRHTAELQRRAEMAQELQDLVAHSLTQITVQMAGARRMVDHDPTLAKQTLTEAEEAGRAAMSEMRRLFDVLKSSDATAQLAPTPGIADLDRLAAAQQAAGVAVTITADGRLDDVPASVGLTVYRVVEEALANARRHAAARRVDVHLVRSGELVQLRVTNPGDHTPPRWERDRACTLDGSDSGVAAGDPHDGGGLRRLQARVTLYGGRLTWARRRDGGFVVEGEVPIIAAGGTP